MLTEFPWNQRWLNGAEYEYLLKNCEQYSSTYAFPVLTDHPNCIYSAPAHGLVYFLQHSTLRELGFPRVKGLKKRFKWKKMNFVTPLPKQRPRVHYLVATGRLGNVCYRMHIVSLGRNYHILCHMLRIQSTFTLGVGIPPRQHFKENVGEELSDTASLEKDPVEIQSVNAEVHVKRERDGLHPLYRMALEYIYAPYKKRA